MPKPRYKTTKEDIFNLIKIYPTVKTKAALAKALNKPNQWINRMIYVIRKNGVDLPKYQKVTTRLTDLINELKAEGKL